MFGDLSLLPQRFWDKVVVTEQGCWEWIAGLDRHGYAKFGGEIRSQLGHRVAYEACVGVIPDGLELDHVCRNTRCVFPGHLEPVTGAENKRRRYAI